MAYSDQTTLFYNTYPLVQNDEGILADLSSNFANSAWKTLLPHYYTAIVLYALEVIIPNLAATECEIEIGLGPLGGEVVSGVVKAAVINANSSCEPWCPFFVPLEVPALTRIAFRIRHQNGDGVGTVAVSPLFYEQAQTLTAGRGRHRKHRVYTTL